MALLTVVGVAIAFTMKLPDLPANTPISSSAMSSIKAGGAIFGALISAVFIFLYWKGFSWMRWVVMIYSLFLIVKLVMIKTTWEASRPAAYLSIATALLAAYLLYYLNTPPVKAWFDGPKIETTA